MRRTDYFRMKPESQATLVIEVLCQEAEKAKGGIIAMDVRKIRRRLGLPSHPLNLAQVSYWLRRIVDKMQYRTIYRRAWKKRLIPIYLIDRPGALEACARKEELLKAVL